jgi:hypothetical protein
VEPPSEIGRPEREGDDVRQRAEPAADPIGPTVYQIRLRGQLSPLWSDWFEGLAITWDDNGDTLLTGSVADQPALHGLLRKIRDLGVTLVAINQLDGSAEPDRGSHEMGED